MNSYKALLSHQVEAAANAAKQWFEAVASTVDGPDFEKRGGMKNAGRGAVYVYYFTETGRAVYVGQTGRTIKARLYDQTSSHVRIEDGRVRFWARIPEFGNRALRVVTLADLTTIHNAFPDRDFKDQPDED